MSHAYALQSRRTLESGLSVVKIVEPVVAFCISPILYSSPRRHTALLLARRMSSQPSALPHVLTRSCPEQSTSARGSALNIHRSCISGIRSSAVILPASPKDLGRGFSGSTRLRRLSRVSSILHNCALEHTISSARKIWMERQARQIKCHMSGSLPTGNFFIS